ncbi:MAG: ABC transporter ATP-binding protein [Pseudorhodoplanes sp.]|uniref:ABC transporter ATP-binding protein n=1 Tax=Pseudorhodoplanes sp. TaxID=1934341 RepID=UPI003D0C864F
MLRLENISVAYGKHEALHGVSIEVPAARTTVILGANGAGKTTLLKTIAGLVQPKPGGRILFEDRPIENEPPHRIVSAGIALVPEGRRLFGEMTVIDNLRLGSYPERARADEARQLERQLATFPRLAERRNQLARTMSGGEQQMLAIARALMSEPKILLLDEPSLGLSPRLIKELFATLRTITRGGQAVVLVEQNAHQSLQLADIVYVLENGRIHSSGSAEQMKKDAGIARAYLGLKAETARTAAAPQPQAMAQPMAAGGFVNPFARTIAPARDELRHSPEGGADLTQRGQTMGGFYNPYARAVSYDFAPKKPEETAPDASAPAHERADLTGGFSNPYARSVEK